MTKRVGKTPVRRAAVMPFAAPMESRPVIGSVDRVDPRGYSRKSMKENDLIWRSSTIAKCWNELSGYRTR
jgi:hypothetical protein